MGCPDVSLLTALSQALGADLTALLSGRLPPEEPSGGTMKRAKYYVCPVCGGITMTTGQGTLSCCGRTLEVRQSNAPARALYEKLGYIQAGLRRNYYENPREDAVIMTKTL